MSHISPKPTAAIKTAMILAAGEGRRMQPLTFTTPKPLLPVANKTLIEFQLEKIVAAGITRVVINVAYLGQQIIDYLGNGERYGVQLDYSVEPEPLETGGALNFALPLLGDKPFVLVNGDVWSDYPLIQLSQLDVGAKALAAHLVMIKNPPHNPDGDFILSDGLVRRADEAIQQHQQISCTFSGISVINPKIITDYPQRRTKFRLREVFDRLIEQQHLTGEMYSGDWMDIGTPERLAELELKLSN